MHKGQLMYEGKAKKLFETNDPNELVVEYKNDLTAFNGQKKAEQQGKGALNNHISSLLFERLSEADIPNHWLKQLSEMEQLVKHTDIIPIEVVIRNVAAGSIAKRLGLEEGLALAFPIIEFYYKDDALGDPLINDDHINLLNLASHDELDEMRELASKVNDVLLELFRACELKLVDFKLEFGKDPSGKLILSDEVSPDTCRLWDVHTNKKLDKDVFRQDLGSVEDSYQEILNRLRGAVAHG
ncbi:phosphoribosylaminoimidazolesuccinocarboxamide synthase [Tenuibacillus multivorans]|uniref:Phosphoribosylaminoimidazole-succinocarboxamide synthase n=1 Tax=Tenuibacillus multivorans TaxID=237069 RepID=A0A1H0F8E7_9BACI|nr:phosphoribosylaminoimidazolesuccinocarboxamide synthase [Tenuibacillus multivorans]GEL78032.1 phosphoribosylaminoimidazole-succinocarboxamide synthase [Tenuibacillus multivorans]SDN90906.1 phosphoribosylaminoimidazole-succinocarboxamide synthase [Tenuibacillus multivorans]